MGDSLPGLAARIPDPKGFRALMLCLAVVLPGAPVHAAVQPLTEPHWVSFHSARAVPSALARRALGDAVDSARPRQALRGLLVVPDGDGPFPAVVLMHGCRGVLASQRGWAQWFARNGFVALLVDSFFTRHASGVCSLGPQEGGRQEVSGRVFDAFGALDYLRADPRVDRQRIAIMGWNSWIPLSAVARGGPQALAAARFSAAVAVSPDCPLDADRPAVPVLMLAAANDELHAVRNCQRLAAHSGGAFELKVLAGAGHGFDDVEAGAGLVSKAVYHLASASRRRIPLRYHRAAHEAATHEVLAFLSPRLGVAGGKRPSRAGPTLPEGARWAVDPSRPGPDRPPVGRSLFDRVFADAQGQVRVPFPFSRVLDRLESELGARPGSRDGLAMSLIPLGRSLQRNAAAPEFFRFPRVVVAIDGEPAAHPARHWLKDRLFLGFQEKARVIEVISYNESFGRFEFQVVDDYAAGATPQVRYANRSVCVSCHQNAAPIFARAAWDETSSNMAVARRLRAAGGGFHRLTGTTGTEAAARVDNATDRANLLTVWQQAWRQGCGAGDAAGRACRGAALVAMLQDRLSGSSGHDRTSAAYRQRFFEPLAARWDALWPGGLAVPDPDLANREPLLDPTPTEISARDDPLTPRSPLAVWHAARDAWRLVPGLAGSLARVDLAAMDRFLRERGREAGVARRSIATSCLGTRRGIRTGRHRVTLHCQGREPVGDLAPDFELTLDLEGRRVLGGSARYLELGDGVLLERVRVVPSESSPRRGSLELRQGQSGWSVRTVRGDALDRVDVDWQRLDEAIDGGEAVAGLVVVHVMADFQPVLRAVASMVSGRDSSLLGDAAFDPLGLMHAVMAAMGASHPAWCCETPVRSPVETSVPDAVNFLAAVPAGMRGSARPGPDDRAAGAGVLSALNRRCGACHRAAIPMPPGFLHGSGPAVQQALRQCAPRIAQRLSMWQHEPEQRERAPMPPPMLLVTQGLDAHAWVASDDYRLLLDWARSQVTGEAATEGLPDCLPGAGVLIQSRTEGSPAR